MTTSSPHETRVAYALIDQSWGLPPHDNESSPFAIRPPSSNDDSANNGVSSVNLTTLEQWYEYYAVRTPSRGYLARQEQFNAEKNNQQQAGREMKSGGGWFGRLFGRGSAKSETVIDDEEDDSEPGSDEVLVTQINLDVNAVNHEATSFHRFHLASEQRALVTSSDMEKKGWTVVVPVRISVGWDDVNTGNAKAQTHLCVVGYGRIAEFPSLPETSFAITEQQAEMGVNGETNQSADAAKISLTSDHNELLSFVANLGKDEPRPLYDLRHCRAASIGSDCLIVSWGLGGDGSISIYRRIETGKKSPRNKRVGFENEPIVNWVAVAYVSPSDSVIEAALHDMTPDPCLHERYKHRQQEHNVGRLFELGSLRVSDLVPMVFGTEALSAVLAVSRIGGFMELLTLPTWIWLDKMTAPPRKLVNLSAASKVTAFSTSLHHNDIMAIDAYRTRAGINIERDKIHSSDALPVEFVLVASGRPAGVSNECQEIDQSGRGAALTFWGITAIQSNDQRDSSFGLNVTCILRCDINNVGSDSSSFVTGLTVEHWSELVQCGNYEFGKNRQYAPSLTGNITASVPVSSLRFTPSPSCNMSDINCGVLLAVLDYNGGVTVMDCSQCILSVERMATHDFSRPDSLVVHTQIIPLTGREISMQTSDKSLGISRASQIAWWRSASLFVVADNGQHEDQLLVDPSSLGTFFLATNTTVSRMHERNSSAANMIRLQRWDLVFNECSESCDPTEVFCIPADEHPSTVLLPMRSQTSGETLSFLRMSSHCHHLSVCGVRKFTDPTEIITVLLHQSDPARALDVARSFGGAEHFGSEIMNNCQIQLWEEQRDINALKLVSDHEYVVREALYLDRRLAEVDGVHMKHLVDIYREGLMRIDELKSGGRSVDSEWLTKSAAEFRKTNRLVGTFELLVHHFADNGILDETFQTGSLARRFLVGFHHCDLLDIASSAASRGDINALSIILVRHPVSTSTRIRLLEMIPVDVDISLYEHLLPCSLDDSQKDGLYLPKSQTGLPKQYLDSLEMLLFLAGSNTTALSVVINESDEDFITRHYQDAYEDFGIQSTSVLASREEVASWYLQTCLRIHNSTRDVIMMKRICELALVRLGLVSFAEDGTYQVSTSRCFPSCDDDSALKKLVYIFHAADLLNCIVRDSWEQLTLVPPLTSVKDWTSETKLFPSVTEFCSMNASDVVSFILEGSLSSNSLSLAEKYIAQFFGGGNCLVSGRNGVIKHDESNALQYDSIVELCLARLRQSRTRKRKIALTEVKDSNGFESRLQQALSVCFVFASLGVNTWAENELSSFACAVFTCTMEVLGDEWINQAATVDHLWSIFETLPYSLLSKPREAKLILRLRLRLVLFQLCSKWGHHHPISHSVISFLCSGTNAGETAEEEEESRVTAACSDALSLVVRGFWKYYIGQNGHRQDLLLDFICDVDEVDKLYFNSLTEHTGSVGATIIPQLLEQHMFKLLRDLVHLRPSWFCREHARAVLLSYVRTTDDATSQQCLDVLGSEFPELLSEADQHQRLRDAKLFAANEMRIDNQLLGQLFSEERSRSPVSLAHALLSSYPESLFIGCEFWCNMSERACADAASYFSSQIIAKMKQTVFDESKYVLPPMPGALVMQLSNILGRLDSLDVLRIKQSMVNGALELGLAPAAIAICFSMLCDTAFARQQQKDGVNVNAKWSDEHEYLVQSCVVSSITGTPNNTQIKMDLCTQALHLFGTGGSPLNLVLLDIFSALEYEELGGHNRGCDSRVGNESGVPSREQSEFLVFKAAELVAKQAKDFVEKSQDIGAVRIGNPFYDLSLVFKEINEEVAIDMKSLMIALRASSLGDKSDRVLNDISQAFFNWAIEHAFKISCSSVLPALKMRVILEMGATCLDELTDKDTAALVVDMALVEFETYSAATENQTSAMNSIHPDAALVQRLHERGYSMNAARRSCIMVKNKSYSEALGWAVLHFQDEDFDSPIVITSTSTDGELQPDLAFLAKRILQSIKSRHENSVAVGSKQSALSSAPPRAPLQLRGDVSQGDRKTLHVTNRTVPTAPPKQPVPTMFLADNAKVSAATTRQPVPPIQMGNNIISHSSVKANPFLETPTNANGATIPNSADSMSSIDGSLGSKASINKQVKQGKVLTRNLTAEDRKRLASEGRRLLEAARMKNRSVVAPPTSITTRPIPRP